jgi:calcineurin-like phosphoesterase family protein
VYFLGDFAMGPKVDENFILSKLYALNGIKLFIIGNHDKPNRKHRQKGLLKIVEENEVDVRFLNDIQEISHDGANFVLCHYPMNDWNGKFHGVIHLHGHAHTQFTPTRSRRQVEEKRYDVGVDMYGGPVELTGDLRYLNDPKGWE